MDMPTHSWGKQYHAPTIHGRRYSSILRIYAKEPGTKIFRDGNEISFIPQAGGEEGFGFQEIRISGDDTPKSAVISGDKPIGVTLYNTGFEEDNRPELNSDPFQMTLTPVGQYQKAMTFCTPGIHGGMGFPENHVYIIFSKIHTRVTIRYSKFRIKLN